MDGYDLSPVLHGTGSSPRKSMFFYHGEQLFAVRHGAHKAHFFTKERYVGQKQARTHNPPLLYHLDHDPSEKHDIAPGNEKIIAEIRELADAHQATVKPVKNQLEERLPKPAKKK